MNRKPMTKAEAMASLERAREDVALILAGTMRTQQQCHALLGITGDLWETLTGEEAPEIEVSPVVRRAVA